MSGAASPQVSVLMALLNPHPRYFSEAVESLFNQTLQDFELLIVEEPGETSAAEQVRAWNDPRIRHFVHPHRTSLVDQYNRGLDLARSDLVARFDADDICEPRRLETQAAFLRDQPAIGVVGSQLTIIDADSRVIGTRDYPQRHQDVLAALPRFNPLAHPSVMYRRGLVLAAGGYAYRRYPAEDYELWSRLAQQDVGLANLGERLLRYRVHPVGSKTTRLRETLRGTIDVKQMHWRDQLRGRARARLLGEKALLWLPPRLVLKMFMRHTYCADTAPEPAAPEATTKACDD